MPKRLLIKAIKYSMAQPIWPLLTAFFILIAVLPVAILTASFYHAAWEDAWREIDEKHRLLAISLATPISGYIQSHQQVMELLSSQVQHSAQPGSNHITTHQLLESSLRAVKGFQYLALYGIDGIQHTAVSTIIQPMASSQKGQSVPCFDMSKVSLKNELSGITLSSVSKRPTIFMCQPVLDINSGALKAMLIGELDIGPLEKMRASIFFGKKGHSALLDQNGRVIAHPNPEWMKQMHSLAGLDIVQTALAGKSGVTEFYSPFVKEQMVAGYAPVPYTGWGVMVPQPKSEVEQLVYASSYSHIGWSLFAIGFAIGIAILLARWITRPINKLASASRLLLVKNFEGDIPDPSPYAPKEIRQLTSTIRILTEVFKNTRDEVNQLNLSLCNRVEDATQKLRHSNANLELMATLDELTEVPNRRGLRDILEREHARAERDGLAYSILLCDLDRFKLINDSYGHAVGDEVLKKFSALVTDMLAEEDCVGRWGGEEFLCLLVDTDMQKAQQTAERLRHLVAKRFVLVNNFKIHISVSIGIATYPSDSQTIEGLVSGADAALYEAKRAGRDRVRQSNGRSEGVFSIGGQLQSALSEGKLKAAYQPIFDIQSGEKVAEETLARIVNGEQSLEANTFIDAASQLQLVHSIDFELISQTIKRFARQPISALHKNRLACFVNISTDLLRHPELIEQLIALLHEYGQQDPVALKKYMPLVIEITEREFLGHTREALLLLRPFLDLGVTLALDDFGSGYSSHRYLADLPVTYLKIDGDLVHRAANEPRVEAVLHTIQDSAASLNVITLAEQVENHETLALLRKLGVNWAQGYLFGRPEIPTD